MMCAKNPLPLLDPPGVLAKLPAHQDGGEDAEEDGQDAEAGDDAVKDEAETEKQGDARDRPVERGHPGTRVQFLMKSAR